MRLIHRVLCLAVPLALASAAAVTGPAAAAGPASAAQAGRLASTAPAGALAAPVASLVDDIAPGPLSSDPRNLTAMNGELFFSAWDPRHGRELWTSDGWPGNTAMAADINPGPASSDPRDITVIGQVAYFTACDPGHGRELWKLTVPPTPEIDLSTPTTTVTAGSPVTVHADLQPAPGEAEPSGRVTFYEDGTEIAAAQLAPDGSGGMIASATLTARSGTHPIVAVYQGDGTYTPATSNTLPLTGN